MVHGEAKTAASVSGTILLRTTGPVVPADSRK